MPRISRADGFVNVRLYFAGKLPGMSRALRMTNIRVDVGMSLTEQLCGERPRGRVTDVRRRDASGELLLTSLTVRRYSKRRFVLGIGMRF